VESHIFQLAPLGQHYETADDHLFTKKLQHRCSHGNKKVARGRAIKRPKSQRRIKKARSHQKKEHYAAVLVEVVAGDSGRRCVRGKVGEPERCIRKKCRSRLRGGEDSARVTLREGIRTITEKN